MTMYFKLQIFRSFFFKHARPNRNRSEWKTVRQRTGIGRRAARMIDAVVVVVVVVVVAAQLTHETCGDDFELA